jgi:hypothetical protein
MDNIYSNAFQNGIPRSKIQNILQLKNKHYEIAFFGSSRIENHINCKLITEITGKSCANFGFSGASPGDMLILMKRASNKNITFNQVFVQVDYNYNSLGITKFFKANLVPFIDEPIIYDQLLFYKEEFLYSRIPFYGFMSFENTVGIREVIASSLKLDQNTNIEIGFVSNQGIGMAVAGNFPESIKYISEEFDLMEKFYKDTSTKLIFFTAPYCKEVRNRNFMEKVKIKLPSLYNYIDIFDNNEEYFFDCGHLNNVGAGVFTRILIEDLLQKK